MNLTLLRARKPLLLAKIWQADGSIVPAADAAWFDALPISIAGLGEMLELIKVIEQRPRVAMVKEEIAKGADPMRLRRRCAAGVDDRTSENYPAGLGVVPIDWVPVDVENLPRPPSIDWRDGDGLAAYARSLLPEAFQNAAGVWQLSGSSGHPTKLDQIRLHFFFKLDEAVLPKAWKVTFAHLPFVDPGFFDNARLIFTAAPIIKSGGDPLALRHGCLKGDPVVRVSQDVLNRSADIVKGNGDVKTVVLPVASAPMPEAAAGFIDIIAASNVLRSQHPAYCNERNRRLAFCSLLRDNFGIQDEALLETAFHKACVGADDPHGGHDAQQALVWARTPPLTGHRFSARKLLCDASIALRAAGDSDTAGQAARLAMVFSNIEARGGCA